MTDNIHPFLKFIKIYSIDNSWQSNKTLYRVIKGAFGNIDREIIQKGLQSFSGLRAGDILEHANNIGDVEFIEKFYDYRDTPIKTSKPKEESYKIEKYNGYSNKDLVVEEFDDEDLSCIK